MLQNQFSKNLKALRKRAGLTQRELAEAVGVDVLTAGNWERKGKIPRQKDTVQKLCSFFGVTENELFGYSDGFFSKETGLSGEPTFGLPLVGSSETAYLPFLGHAHAGSFEDPLTIEGAVVEVPKSVADGHPSARMIIIDGNCIDKVAPPGELAGIDPKMEPRNGSIVCARYNDELILRQYFKGSNMIMLSPCSHSDEFEDIIFRVGEDEGQLDLEGVMFWHQAMEEMD